MKTLIGAAALLGGWFALVPLWERVPGGRDLASRLRRAATEDPVMVTFEGRGTPRVEVGDPVYVVVEEAFAPVGEVIHLGREEDRWTARLHLDPSAPLDRELPFAAFTYRTPYDLLWMGKVLMPLEAREKLLRDLRAVWEQQDPPVLDELRPEILALLGDLTKILEDSLPAAFEAESESGARFFEVLQTEIYGEELQPVLEAEVFPRFRERMTAETTSIANEIGQQITGGDIGRLVWAVSRKQVWLGTEGDVQWELRRIFEERALPVLERRGPELAQLALTLAQEGLQNEKLRQAIDEAMWKLVQHPAFQSWSDAVLRRAVVENELLRARLRQALEDPRLRRPFDDLMDEMEPVIEAHLEEMLARDDRAGMDHQLVRVLRRMVLGKDRRYVLLAPVWEQRARTLRGNPLPLETFSGEGAPLASGRLPHREGGDR